VPISSVTILGGGAEISPMSCVMQQEVRVVRGGSEDGRSEEGAQMKMLFFPERNPNACEAEALALTGTGVGAGDGNGVGHKRSLNIQFCPSKLQKLRPRHTIFRALSR
jgi:hypothetical protein